MRRGAAVFTTVLAIASSAGPAVGAPVGNRRPIAVSVPSEPAELGAGHIGTVPIRIVNPGSTRVTVKISGRGVSLGDDGRATMTDRDPIWDGRVEFPSQPIAIAARSYQDVSLVVRMPARIDPDLYFIGFLVTPLSDVKANLTYVNQIGSYVTIDVPGPRTRLLTADLNLSRFAIASNARGTLRIHNAGKAAAIFWGENVTTAAPGSAVSRQPRIDRSLLPKGRSRTIVIDEQPSFPFAFVTVHIHLFYAGRTDATTKEVTLTRTALVISPVALVLLGGVILSVSLWLVHRRRKRTARKRAGPRAARREPSRNNHNPKPRAWSARRRVRGRSAARLDRQLARVRGSSESR